MKKVLRFERLFVVLCWLLLPALVSCGNNNSVSISDVNRDTGLSLPPSSTITDSIRSGAIVDEVFALRVSVIKADYPALLSDLSSMPADNSTRYSSAYAGKVSWWQPVNILQENFYDLSGTFVYAAVSDHRSNYVLYLEYGTY